MIDVDVRPPHVGSTRMRPISWSPTSARHQPSPSARMASCSRRPGTHGWRIALGEVQERAALPDGVDHHRLTPIPSQGTGIPRLASAPSVEDRSIEDDAPGPHLVDGRLARTRIGVGGTQLLGHADRVADLGAGPRAPEAVPPQP